MPTTFVIIFFRGAKFKFGARLVSPFSRSAKTIPLPGCNVNSHAVDRSFMAETKKSRAGKRFCAAGGPGTINCANKTLLSRVSHYLSSPTAYFQCDIAFSNSMTWSVVSWDSLESGRILLLCLRGVLGSISRYPLSPRPCKVLRMNTWLPEFLTFSQEKLPVSFLQTL